MWWNSAYVELGEFGPAVPVTDPDILAVDAERSYAKPTVALKVDGEGDIIDYVSINPLA
jgi:hypothetical protein